MRILRHLYALAIMAALFNTDGGGEGGDGTGGDAGGGDDPKAKETTSGGEGGGNDTTESKLFSQEDVSAVATTEARKAAQAERKRLADELGVSVAEARKIITDAKAQAEAEKDEITKAKDAVAAAEAAAATAMAEAKTALLRAEVLEQLASTGDAAQPVDPLNPARNTAALTLAMPLAAAADTEDLGEAAAIAVAEVRKMSPEWFGTPSTGGTSGGGTGTPGRTGKETKSTGKLSMMEQGAQDLAAAGPNFLGGDATDRFKDL